MSNPRRSRFVSDLAAARPAALAVFLVLGAATAAQAQQISVAAERLAVLPQLVSGRASDAAGAELTVRWGPPGRPSAIEAVTPAPAPSAPRAFDLLSRRAVTGLPSEERNPQLSEDSLVVFGVTADGSESGWQIVRDPSVVRAESADASGLLSGQVLHRDDATFVVTIPLPSALVALRIYKPRWTGTAFVLDLAGSVSLSGAVR